MEKILEKALYQSRWLLAPLYLGLSIILVILGIKFFQEIIHVTPVVFHQTESDLILMILTFVDLTLVGGLIVMVMLSGYQNFVSTIDIDTKGDKLSWLGKLDAGSLKQKVAASIVAISSIHLLKAFMNLANIPNDKLLWYVILHLTFVVSALLMSVIDKMAKGGD